MFPADFPITPTEIEALESYIKRLEEDSFYRTERQSKLTEQFVLDTARQLLKYHRDKSKLLRESMWHEGRHYDIDFMIEQAKQDLSLKVLLSEQKDFILYLSKLYIMSLGQLDRHLVLNKPLTEMTGYDFYRLVSYITQDSQST